MWLKRKGWNGLISGFSASDLVFLDESGCNTGMTQCGMPIRLAKAELLVLHHFPSPGTRLFCSPSSWMGHYTIRLSQAERLWSGLSGIWKLICFLI